MEEILGVFIQESREQLSAMEADLLGMEQGDLDPETLNSIFRAAHTIKGGSGVVELGMIEKFTHVVENALDKLRNNEISVSGTLISILLNCCDHIGALLDCAAAGETKADATLQSDGETLADKLRTCIGDQDGSTATTIVTHAEDAAALESTGGGKTLNDCWHISIRFGQNVLRNGMDPSSILHYLLSLGEIAHITTLADAIPAATEMNPESCYLGFEINFRSHASKEAIERVFDFVRDDCKLFILPPHSKLADYLRLIDELPEETLRLGEILVKSGALTKEELNDGLTLQLTESTTAEEASGSEPPSPHRLGEILIEGRMIQPEIVEAAVSKQKQVSDKKADESRLIRVHADKLDQLIDLVGELVIAGASANLLAQKSKMSNLVEATSVLTRLVESIRDSALQLRMVQIGDTFNRFNRVVRDTAKELGKEIELVITGADTELDKSVVEKIGDPLMHLVRNAMDHGLETAAERIARGKPAQGRVALNAFHDSGSIVIEVADDGGGLPRERIRAKAIERGIISANQVLNDQEIADLIFEAGFSTAEKVTNLSGRGVGMDVVRRNIQALRGSVEVQSEEGLGSRFIIRLPLTLAIIDGFLVGVDKASYVIPLDMVVECMELTEAESTDTVERNYLNLRGEVLPFVRLRELFEITSERPRRENVVVVKSGGHKAGIVVDVLQGEFQTVIKPLGAIFRHLRGIAGSTILGSGDVALILDVQTLAQLAARAEEHLLSKAGACA